GVSPHLAGTRVLQTKAEWGGSAAIPPSPRSRREPTLAEGSGGIPAAESGPWVLNALQMTTRPESGQPIGWKSALIALAVGVVRGGNQVAIKFALTAFSPLWSAFARMAVSMATISFWAAISRRDL